MSIQPTAQASGHFENDATGGIKSSSHPKLRRIQGALAAHASRDILLFLIAFRILNALSVSTFFQPDEYFQSLEPAWQMAFGAESGAWITWEWKHQLRSSIHPALFATVYKLANSLSMILQLSPPVHSELMIAAPKILQALFAALGDYATWSLSERIYGRNSKESWAALALTVINPWNWFCSTRTLSNCLETTLTITALNAWPWHWSLEDDRKEPSFDQDRLRTAPGQSALGGQADVLTGLRRCLLLAALACILRPTNILIWLCLTWLIAFRVTVNDPSIPQRQQASQVRRSISCALMTRATPRERYILVREALTCGTLVLTLSALVDRNYYGRWTMPPLRFLYFNLAQSLAIFYGRNDWHYYLSQGFPILTTTLLPFAAIGVWRSLPRFTTSDSPNSKEDHSTLILQNLALTTVLVPLPLSLISHKEFRFIYPLLPPLHILAARPFSAFFTPPTRSSLPRGLLRRLLLTIILASSLAIAIFTTKYHQPAPLNVLSYLRNEHISHFLTQPPQTAHIPQADSTMSVGFLMPCHSTPWRSHLVFPSIKAWALSCEPPVNLNASEKASYLDEADIFYLNPREFLMDRLEEVPKGKSDARGILHEARAGVQQEEVGRNWAWDGREGRKMWPEYLVFFEALEPTLQEFLNGSAYGECWRSWNSFFHDDRRRKGDVVVWCLQARKRAEAD